VRAGRRGRGTLPEYRLHLALRAVVAREAFAEARVVVAQSSSRAVPALRVAHAREDVRARGALLERAVRPAESEITDAADVLHGVPGRRVDRTRFRCQLLLRVADAAVRAVVRAAGSLTRNTLVAVEAVALAGLAVAGALVRALGHAVDVVVAGDGVLDPGRVLGARALGAVGGLPGRVVVRAQVAGAAVVGAARAVARAAVRAVRVGRGGEEEELVHC
jgi:hypothetical protein